MSIPYSIDERWTIKKFEETTYNGAMSIELQSKEFKFQIEKQSGSDWALVTLSVKTPNHRKDFVMSFNFKEYLSKNKIGPTPYDLIEKAQLILIDEGTLFGKPMMEMCFEGTKE
jgi:hypothetical protein